MRSCKRVDRLPRERAEVLFTGFGGCEDGPTWHDVAVTTNIDLEEVIAQVRGKLSASHPDWDSAEIERVAREELAAIADSPVQDFLLVLTERATKKRLKRR